MSPILVPGQIMPFCRSPGYIILSCVVSYIGCLTALELLRRRTHHGGYYNWFLLAGAATAMGGVAIWSMHYIGMQAIILANGEKELQLYYYASYTAGSFFLPIAVVSLSFSVFSNFRKISAVRIVAAGVICGAAICGMHYVGQTGIVNYSSTWKWRYIFGSVIIAISAATVALGIFFYLSSKWINSLCKRALCALILAGAVCSMHWIAIYGTTFRWKGVTSLPAGLSKTGAVWACGSLALLCCVALLTLAIAFQYVQRVYAKKAQQLSLALAYFTPDGHIMLNNNGRLPLNRITKNYLQYSAKDDFNVDTAPFSWMYRASRSWTCVDSLMPSMRAHIRLEQDADNASILSMVDPKEHAGLTSLKELYCVAAEDLASTVGVSLSEVGSLYDRILNTGRMTSHTETFLSTRMMNSGGELESRSSVALTRGQVLFLVRNLGHSEVIRLRSNGYSFAPLRSVVAPVATSMQIMPSELRPFLEDLASYKNMPRMLEIGVHVACFIVRPVVKGFEILAQKAVRNQLPLISLPLKKLEQSQISLLTQFDGWTATTFLNHWMLTFRQDLTEAQCELIDLLCDAIVRLRDRVGDEIYGKSKLIALPISDPGIDGDIPGAGTAILLAFRYVTDIHYTHPATSPDLFVNARLFMTQQHCYPGSPDHAVFAGQVHLEFSSFSDGSISPTDTIQGISTDQGSKPGKLYLFPRMFRTPSISPLHPASVHGQSWGRASRLDRTRAKSISNLEDETHPEDHQTNSPGPQQDINTQSLLRPTTKPILPPILTRVKRKPRSIFKNGGGVHVSNEIHVTVVDADSATTDMVELDEMGMKTEIGAVKERESAVDKLMALTLGELKK